MFIICYVSLGYILTRVQLLLDVTTLRVIVPGIALDPGYLEGSYALLAIHVGKKLFVIVVQQGREMAFSYLLGIIRVPTLRGRHHLSQAILVDVAYHVSYVHVVSPSGLHSEQSQGMLLIGGPVTVSSSDDGQL